MAAGTSQPHLQAPVFAPPKHLSNRPHPVQSNLVSKSKSSLLDIQDFPPLTIPISIGTSNLKIVEAVQPQDCCPVNVESKAPALPGSVPHTTYSAVLKGNQPAPSTQQQEDCGLEDVHLHPVSHFEGKTAVFFPIEDQSKLVDKFKFVLIGKFSHGRPSWTHIKSFFHELKLNGTYNISIFDSKHLYIECSKRIDYNRIWLRLQWRVAGFVMRILKWTPQFSPVIESPIVPLWIQMDGLPLYVFDEMPLWHIANAIGKPIKIDVRNLNGTMRNIARVCVELDLTKPIVDSFWVCFEDKNTGVVIEKICVNVAYDFIPSYCVDCAHVGHKKEQCKRQQSSCSVENLEQQKVQGKKELKETAAISIADTVPAAVVKDKETRTMQTWIPKASNKPAMLSHSVVVANNFAALTEFKSQDNEFMQQAKEVDSLKFDSVSLDKEVQSKAFNTKGKEIVSFGENSAAEKIQHSLDVNMMVGATAVVKENVQTQYECIPPLPHQEKTRMMSTLNLDEQKQLLSKHHMDTKMAEVVSDLPNSEESQSIVVWAGHDIIAAPSIVPNVQVPMPTSVAIEDCREENLQNVEEIADELFEASSTPSASEQVVRDLNAEFLAQNEVYAEVNQPFTMEINQDNCSTLQHSSEKLSDSHCPALEDKSEWQLVTRNKNKRPITTKAGSFVDCVPAEESAHSLSAKKTELKDAIVPFISAIDHQATPTRTDLDPQASPYTPSTSTFVQPKNTLVEPTQSKQRINDGQKTYKLHGAVTRAQSNTSNVTWADQVEEDQLALLSRKQLDKKISKLASRINNMGLKHALRGQLIAEMDVLHQHFIKRYPPNRSKAYQS